MKKINLQSLATKRRRKTYKKVEENLISKNLLNQKILTSSKNKIWVGDITYIPVANTNIYLSIFIDIFTRKVVGWTVAKRMDQTLVITSFEKAIRSKRPSKGLIVHTDRGLQYTSKKYRKILGKFETIEKSKMQSFEHIEMFYNTKRLHSSLGYMSSIQFENRF